VVPESDEGVRSVEEERAEFLRHAFGVRKLEDEATAANAKLQRVRRRIGAAGPLDAEADDEAFPADVLLAEVEP